MMPRHRFCLLLLLSHPILIQADEPAPFTPPQAYPAERYGAGWNKNPFTLKTVAPVAAQDSFARDLAIGAHYGAADNPTVVVVNTKTNERILLQKDKPAPNGMRLVSLHAAISRGECQAEVAQGGEVAMLKYDAAYLGQLATAAAVGRVATKPGVAPGAKEVRLPPLPVPAGNPVARPVARVSSVEPPVPITPAAVPSRVRLSEPPLPGTVR